MSVHTSGPWFVEKGVGLGAATARRQVAELVDGRTGLQLYRIVHDGRQDGDAEADARLIAAAPEQNAALLSAPEPGPWCGTSQAGLLYADWWRDVRGLAIAKAAGR